MITADISTSIRNLDAEFFRFINTEQTNPLLDVIMPLLRNPFIWTPVYGFFALFFLYNYNKKALIIIGFLLLAFLLSDQISSHLLKPLAGRLRPCAAEEQIRMLVNCGSGKSFPSTHAANHFMFSVFLITLIPTFRKEISVYLIAWALLVCYAQVYVGLHYPLDVIGGGILGSFIGYYMAVLCRRFVVIET